MFPLHFWLGGHIARTNTQETTTSCTGSIREKNEENTQRLIAKRGRESTTTMTKRREEKKKTNEKIDFYKKLTKQVNLSSCKTIIEHLQRNQSKNKYGFFLVFFFSLLGKASKEKNTRHKVACKRKQTHTNTEKK